MNAFPAAPPSPTVRVVHPCGDLWRATDAGHFQAGLDALRRLGCEVRTTPGGAERSWGSRKLAGTDAQRRDELVAALTDPDVDIVWIARGGHGAARITGAVLEAVAGAPPKIVVGFSDASTLINALAAHGWPTVHGPVITSLTKRVPAVDLPGVLDVLCGRVAQIDFAPQMGTPISSPVFGGNLTVLASICGLGWLPRRQGAIWLIEDTGEHPYAIDRAFTQVRLGPLSAAGALWLGPLDTTVRSEASIARAVIEADAPCPVFTGAPIGHSGPNAAVPLGVPVTLDPRAGTLTWSVEHRHA